MSSSATMPSLSTDGWVTGSLKTADYLFSHFFASDHSQSYTFPEGVTSFSYILHTNQGDIPATIRSLESVLSKYFSRFFENVTVEVDDSLTAAGSSSVSLSLFINFTDTVGTTYTLGKMVEYTNTTISKIISINNG
jgi:hypothetical protein